MNANLPAAVVASCPSGKPAITGIAGGPFNTQMPIYLELWGPAVPQVNLF